MIDATIKLTVPPQRRKELLQTFKLILDPIRRESGCVCCHCYVDIEDENVFFFKAEWQSREALDAHLQSAQFAVLSGAMGLLNAEPKIRICNDTSTMGVKVVTAARVMNSGSPP
jgi:quinol monooxygenase YgiN